MKVIVPYARNRIAYAVLTSLSRAGYHCYAADSVSLPVGRFSIHSRRFFKYPDPLKSETAFVEWCRDKVDEGYLIFPTFMESWILRRHKLIQAASIMPPYSTIIKANNKYTVNCICHQIGVPAPGTTLIHNSVLKPIDSRGSAGRFYIDKAMLQERIYGDAIGVGMLFNRGSLKAQFAWRRLTEYPADGGMSIIRESIEASEHCEVARQLLEALEWHGVAMVEFKDQYVIEVNPRFWGSLHHAVNSGVDFPRLLMDIMIKGDCDTVLDYPIGVKTSWLAGCIRTRRKPQGKAEDFYWRDPLPFFAQFILPVTNALRGRGLVLDEN